MIRLFDAATSAEIGTLSEEQLQFLVDRLEEESAEDQDYYINAETLDMFEQSGADASLVAMLRRALGTRPDMDIRWER